jgi:hypothetical protein
MLYATDIIFGVHKSFQTSVLPPQVLSPAETADVGPTTIGEDAP